MAEQFYGEKVLELLLDNNVYLSDGCSSDENAVMVLLT